MPTPSRNQSSTPNPEWSDRDFGDAMADVVRGCKVARREWGETSRVFLHAGVLHIQIDADDPEHNLKAGLHKFLVAEGDLVAADWIVVR